MKSIELSKIYLKNTSRPMRMNLQYFAEGGGEGGEGGEGGTGSGDDGAGEGDDQEEITPAMQVIINRVVGIEKAKMKAKAEAEKKEAADKAAKLASMSAEERKKAEDADKEAALAKRESEIAMKEYRFEAKRQLNDAKLSEDLVDIILADDPEVTKANIEALKKQIDADVEAKVKERLAGKSPMTGNSIGSAKGEYGKQLAEKSKAPEVKKSYF